MKRVNQLPPAEVSEHWMRLALEQAQQAEMIDEVPVGAVVVQVTEDQYRLIAKSHNLRETQNSPTAHAEVLAIESAAKTLGRWRLNDCLLYVTLEPCVMCTGAIVNARIGGVVYGASDPKGGGIESQYQILSDKRLNHHPLVASGCLAQPCSHQLTSYFRKKREASLSLQKT